MVTLSGRPIEGHLTADLAVRVGIDLASVSEVQTSIERFGPRYLERILTEAELADVMSTDSSATSLAQSVAARFAAKEAAIKVLQPSAAGLDWHHIEVLRRPSGAPRLRLSGGAADLARAVGIRELAVSLTHEAALAGAVVVALCTDPTAVEASSEVDRKAS